MKAVLYGSLSVSCLTVAAGLWLLLADLRIATRAWGALPGALITESMQYRLVVDHRMQDALRLAGEEASATRTTLDRRLASIEQAARAEVRAASSPLSSAAERVADDVGQVTSDLSALTRNLDKSATQAASLTSQIAEAAPLWLDCGHNPNCAFNRYVGTARGIEQTARALGEQAPQLTKSAAQIAESTRLTAANVERITRPDRWYVRAFKLVGPFVTGWVFGELRK